ncbi:MAG: chlorophyllase [Terracoccus sp.]
MSQPFTDAAGLPVGAAQPVVTFSPVSLTVAGRPATLTIKVSAPVAGERLPVILFSHGHGASNFLSSLHGYGPLVDFWAAHGFVVLQPTHLDFPGLGLRDTDAEGAPLFWRSRVEDMSIVLDHLDEIEATVPGLTGRVDWTRIAAVGHSLGGHTVAALCGMTVPDPHDTTAVDLRDNRVIAGVIMAGPGAGDGLTGPAADRFTDLTSTDFSGMTGQALVVVGDHDHNPFFTDQEGWRTDPYYRSPGTNKTLLTMLGAEHMLGGVSGYDADETTDENPERVATLCALVWAYLTTALHPDDPSWSRASEALARQANPMAHIETRQAAETP